MLNKILMLISFLFFFLFIPVGSTFANPIDLDNTQVKNCYESVKKFACNDAFSTSEQNSLYDCLKKINKDDKVWQCSGNYDPVDLITSPPDIGACATNFAKTVCANTQNITGEYRELGIGQIKYSNPGGCVDYCNGLGLDRWEDLFNSKTPLFCKDQISTFAKGMRDGIYDKNIRPDCTYEMRDICLARALLETKTKIKTQQYCETFELDANDVSNITVAFNERFDALLNKPPEEVVGARSKILEIIKQCQVDVTSPQVCTDYTTCVVNKVNEIPTADVFWSCTNSSLDRCREEMISYVGRAFNVWHAGVDFSAISTNCTFQNGIAYDSTAAVVLFNDNLKRLLASQDFIDKIKSHSELTDKETYTDSLWVDPAPDTSTLSNTDLATAFENLNCGFAIPVSTDSASIKYTNVNGKNKCCKNEVEDLTFTPPEEQCIIPAPWFGFTNKCFLGSKVFTDKFFAKLNTDLVNKTDNLKSFISENKGVPPCFLGDPSNPSDLNNCVCNFPDGAELCRNYISENKNADCVRCMQNNGVKSSGEKVLKIYTALGCIDTSTSGITKYVFSFGLGLAGIAATLCIIFAGISFQTSQGNPEKIKKSQELITSCITGLILIIFSVLILRIIGVDILRIPEFGI